MNAMIKRMAAAALAAALVAAGPAACGRPPEEVSDPSPTHTAPAPSASPAVPGQSVDKLFTVRYSADSSLNPITGSQPDNVALAPLMYESLFVLDAGFQAQPQLCESYETVDGRVYTLQLKPGVVFSDGTPLGAADVRYSLLEARQADRFSGRLTMVDGIEATGALTLKITLSEVNRRLPELLDVPVIKSGSLASGQPAGTGPYALAETGAPRLVLQSRHRDSGRMPAQAIYLRDCTDMELSVSFASGAIDLFWDDPADAAEIHVLSDHEVRYYNTTILQYVGFNANTRVLSDPALRRALGLAIDRKSIVDTVYRSHAVAAPLALSPAYAHYDRSWEPDMGDSLAEMSSIFNDLNMRDDNNDGYLEYPGSGGGGTPFTLKFIVHADNRYSVAAAEKITQALKASGISVSLSPLSWGAYTQALESGGFDLYYADVRLPGSFDLTQLLAPGGALDFGQSGAASYETLIRAFLSADGDDAVVEAARRLCAAVEEEAPILPVLYRQYAVHTNRNVISGLSPTQSSIFYGLADWTMSLG